MSLPARRANLPVKRSLVHRVALIAASLLTYGCGGSTEPPGVASVAITPSSVTLAALTATRQLAAEARAAAGTAIAGKIFTWSSSSQTVATVSAGGLVTAVANGTATITATTDGVSGTAAVTVAQAVSQVTVTPSSSTLSAINDTVRFSAATVDASGRPVPGQTVTWTSSAAAVATVDANGLAKAVGLGSATITATLGTVSGTATLAVTVAVASVGVAPADTTLTAVGDTARLRATARDAGGTPIVNAAFTWASSDATVVTVNTVGRVTAVKIGTATITATAGTRAGVATVTVVQAGSGTRRLQVIASVTAVDVPGGFTTDFAATVRNAATAAVSGATVNITHATLGIVTLAETATPGLYSAARPSFPGGEFELDVFTAADTVRDVVGQGPGVHTVTTPTANGVVVANQPLVVRWTRPLQAALAEIETRNFALTSFPDTGAYTVPAAGNPPTNSQRIRVFRSNTVNAVGGLAGSQLTIKVRQQVEPVIAAASLTVAGDATFQAAAAHGGQPISVALVRLSDGVRLQRLNGTVSATAAPAFSFSFTGLLRAGETYEVRYWIDSNVGGGTPGVCDPKANDHQWKVAVPAVTGPDLSITEMHNDAATFDVCATFATP